MSVCEVCRQETVDGFDLTSGSLRRGLIFRENELVFSGGEFLPQTEWGRTRLTVEFNTSKTL